MKNKKIISFISTINLRTLKNYTKNKNISRVIPLPFIGMKKGPIIICSSDKSLKSFFQTWKDFLLLKMKNYRKHSGQHHHLWLLIIICYYQLVAG